MKLTIAQSETLRSLARLGRKKFHTVHNIVRGREKVRTGDHSIHFEKHWGLLINKTTDKLTELKAEGLCRSGRGEKKTDTGWMITVKGEKLAATL
jgi:hypothetical protein